eukprot:112314_1
MDTCSSIYTGSYWTYVVILPLVIVIQLFLLSHAIYHEYTKRNNKKFQKISLRTRIAYLLLQCIGLYWTVVELFRLVIDPASLVMQEGVGCQFAAYTPKTAPPLFYSVYLYQIVLRLQSSFKGSYLELSRVTYYVLLIAIAVPMIIGCVVVFGISAREESACIATWIPNDFRQTTFCELPVTKTTINTLILGFLWIPLINVVFGAMFGIKLNKLMSSQEDNKAIRFKLKSLIVKNTICTLTGSISTVTCWFLYIAFSASQGGLFLFVDLIINSTSVGMMFQHNEKWYKRCCKGCITLCFTSCNKNKDKEKDAKKMARYMQVTSMADSMPSMTSTSEPTVCEPPEPEHNVLVDSPTSADNNQSIQPVEED